nr:MAG TPA: hypothetical protein [Caudoviricetes sp.]
MCGGDNKHRVVVEVTRTTHSRQSQNTRARVVLRACSQGCARTTQHTPTHKQRKTRREEKRRE